MGFRGLKFILSGLFLLAGSFTSLKAQVITTGPDSVEVNPPPAPKDTIPFYKIGQWSQPGKAALYSAILPGLGQAYNKSYWKIPVIYVGAGVLGYFLYTNHKEYLHYRSGVKVRLDADSTNNNDRYTERISNRTPADQIAILKKGRDTYRRWRDQNILLCIVFYTINVAEAYTYAHLKDFDISDDLSMKVQPDFIFTGSNKFLPALTFSIKFKNNAHSLNRLR
jgi:hypothetical protein